MRVLIVHDHPLLASAIKEILEAEPDLKVCGVASTGRSAIAMASTDKPNVVLMAHRLPDVEAPAVAAVILGALPQVAIVFHSAEDSQDSEQAVLDAIDAGATGYLSKTTTAEELISAVRRAARGEILIPTALFAKAVQRHRTGALPEAAGTPPETRFTRRELEVLRLMAAGLDTTTIADQLGIADHTVEWHVRHVIEKLHVHSKLQAVVEAARQGLVEL